MEKKRILFVACAAAALAGCAKEGQFETINQICVGGTSQAEMMEAAEDVLSKMHFSIDKADAELGYVRTNPLSGAQYFEFWRKDNVGAFSAAEANIHSIRRIVELDITRKGGELCTTCKAKIQRLSLSERRDETSRLAYEKFSARMVSDEKLELQAGEKAWLDLGEDEKLATVILKEIEKQLKKESEKKQER
ncbi:MAG: hypothetical protein ACYSYU_05455 [Planctomycetota bacterium]|jgi:hypothetical protein